MQERKTRFQEFLKGKGLKLTPERFAVLGEALAAEGHFDADQLFERVQRYNKKVSRATIYLVIPLLVEAGLITETLRCQGRVSYECLQEGSRHDHMVCIAFGAVIEFAEGRLEALIRQITAESGFVAIEHRLGVRGYCRDCVARGFTATSQPPRDAAQPESEEYAYDTE